MKWFKNPETLEDLKKQYKHLAMKHHPDMGGSTQDMQGINAEYEQLFAMLKDTHKNAEGKFYQARTATTEAADPYGWHRHRDLRFLGVGHWGHEAPP